MVAASFTAAKFLASVAVRSGGDRAPPLPDAGSASMRPCLRTALAVSSDVLVGNKAAQAASGQPVVELDPSFPKKIGQIIILGGAYSVNGNVNPAADANPKKTPGDILLLQTSKQLNSGKVVAVGPGKRDNDGKLIPVALKEGDTVLLPEYGGLEVKLAPEKDEEFKDKEMSDVRKLDIRHK